MFKLDRKLLVSASVATVVALVAVGCGGSEEVTPAAKQVKTSSVKLGVDGGSLYPVTNGMTGPYYVNTKSIGMKLNNGRVPTKAEVTHWDTDLQPVTALSPDGHGIPDGSGSVEDGEEIYEAQCVMCHGDFGSGGGGYPALSKGNAEELQQTLKNQRNHPDADGPVREFGSYWPQATTLWWYIRDGMPHPKSDTLSADDTYALVAYILNINEMSIDGVEVDDEYVLDRAKFMKIQMPNKEGFEPDIRGANALPVVRAYYGKASNFGGQNLNQGDERCMHDCQKATVKVAYIQNGGISSFIPSMDTARNLPAKKAEAIDVKKVYTNSCAMCHDSYLAPGAPEWAGYTSEGMKMVYTKGIEGTEGGMPAKGGADLSDKDFKILVDYLVTGKVK